MSWFFFVFIEILVSMTDYVQKCSSIYYFAIMQWLEMFNSKCFNTIFPWKSHIFAIFLQLIRFYRFYCGWQLNWLFFLFFNFFYNFDKYFDSVTIGQCTFLGALKFIQQSSAIPTIEFNNNFFWKFHLATDHLVSNSITSQWKHNFSPFSLSVFNQKPKNSVLTSDF